MKCQKFNNVLILFFTVLIIQGCKKESKEYTTARWEFMNPVTGEPYVGVPVALILKKYHGVSPGTEIIWEGETNEYGIAEYKFKAYLKNKYGYLETADLDVFGDLGYDYSIISRPPVQGLNKDEVNELRYEIVPYAYMKQIIKNVNCEGTGDQIELNIKLFNLESKYNETLTIDGCYEYETTGSLDGSPDGYRRVYMGTYIYDYEVTRQSGTTYGSDTITLNDGEMGTIEVL